MPHKLKYTDQQMLDRACVFYKKNNKPPRIADFNPGFAVTAAKRFGSWNNYIDAALKMRANYHNWKPEELTFLVRTFWEKNHRFPVQNELTEDGRDIDKILIKHFGSINKYFESAIGTSPRVEILRAIKELTPPGCHVATPAEILAQIRKKIPFPTNLCSFNMRTLSVDGYVMSGKYDRTRWHKLTPKGREFLKSFEASK
ncbi:MAG: hypothetical protein ABSA44_09760 [Bacteroidota bacterium]|jgi:predicted transcriptional regulator